MKTLLLLQKTNISVKINDYLKMYRGKSSEELLDFKLAKYTNEEKAQIIEMNKNVDIIDEIFKNAPIKNSMYVYERLPQESMIDYHLSLLNLDQSINTHVAELIVKQWRGQEIKQYPYLWASTNHNQDYDGNSPIILKFHLPKGTHVAYLPNSKSMEKNELNNLLIERNLKFKFVNFSIVNEKINKH